MTIRAMTGQGPLAIREVARQSTYSGALLYVIISGSSTNLNEQGV